MKPPPYSQDATVHLVPVIEMLPTDYGCPDIPMPSFVNREAWLQYWFACLVNSGIEGLRPLDRGWYVPIEHLTSTHTLKQVIHAHRYDTSSDNPKDHYDRFSDPEEYLLTFSGGYALSIDDQVVCTPRCCADLKDIHEWQMAADYRSAEWSRVWIGHPDIKFYFDGACLVFVDTDEGHGQTEWTGELVVAPEALQQAVVHAKQVLQEFYLRLLPVVESIAPPSKAVQITEILTASKST